MDSKFTGKDCEENCGIDIQELLRNGIFNILNPAAQGRIDYKSFVYACSKKRIDEIMELFEPYLKK